MIWTICIVLGILTVAFAPLLVGTAIKILSSFGRKFPALADVVATITAIIVGAILLTMSIMCAAVYHHLITGTP